jgi:hypothetical protein
MAADRRNSAVSRPAWDFSKATEAHVQPPNIDIQHGNTKVLVQCHGPRQIRQNDESLTVDFNVSSFAGNKVRHFI